VIYKERASAFFGTPLIAHLQMMKIDSLIICGESTSGCVRASTVDAYSYGFHNVVVEECTYDRSPICHKVNLVRPASQICGRDAHRGGAGASRRTRTGA
jgi:nicotinamidase-related amidase